MRRALLVLVCAAVAAGACTAPPPATPSAEAQLAAPSAQASPTLAGNFEVDVWVDNAAPSRGQRVTVSGSLIKNGVRLGGIMMDATWPDATRERGAGRCYVQVIYGAGVCAIEAADMLPDVFVPVTVTFDYGGVTYTGHTGFTPH